MTATPPLLAKLLTATPLTNAAVGLLLPAAARTRLRRPQGAPSGSSRRTGLHSAGEPSARSNGAASHQPPVLLTSPNNHGTLAAVRSLGRHGVPVTIADPQLLTIASTSKYATSAVRCPPVRWTEQFLDWLMTFGRTHERHVLLPTCDDTVWLYALHREQLSQHFFMGVPDITVLHQLLNKRLLTELAARVGLATPRSWFPATQSEVEQIGRSAHFPLLIKPITQVMFYPRTKGFWVHSVQELLEAYPRLARDPYAKAVLEYDGSISRPMVQEFYPTAARNGVLSISGHARGGQVLAARAARKVLQWPRRFGVGVCFEEAALENELVSELTKLIAQAGFHGTFEAEFLEDGERRLLIDFNPRFYNQMGFDVARGAALPMLAYRDAIDPESSSPPAELETTTGAPRIYAHGSALRMLLGAQRLSGVVAPSELERWLNWYEQHREQSVDAVFDTDDDGPARLDAALILKDCVRHPWRFLRVIALNR